MRGHEAAHENEGFRRLLWAIVLAASFYVFLTLSAPAPAQAQVVIPCPPGPLNLPPGKTECRPVCETPSFTLTATPTGDGAFTASAQTPYFPSLYDDRGLRECATQTAANTWDVKKNCASDPTYHCIHWHTTIVPWGVPLPSVALVTPVPGVDQFFTGWTSGNCAPSTKIAVNRNVCSIVMDADKTVSANFAVTADSLPPDPAPALTVDVLNVNTVKLTWSPSDDETWLGGYEILRDGGVYSRVSTATTSVTLGGQLCKSTHDWQVRAFDATNATPSNAVDDVFMGSTCPKAKRLNTQLHVWPPRVTTARSAFFHWGAKRNGTEVAYSKFKSQCRMDNGRWKSCRPGKTYKRLKPGKHVFRVRAFDAAGKDLTPATYRWTIRA